MISLDMVKYFQGTEDYRNYFGFPPVLEQQPIQLGTRHCCAWSVNILQVCSTAQLL